MHTFSATLPLPCTDTYTLGIFHEKALFFDIETTGLSADRSQVYLIGCACRRDGQVTVRQYFAETPAEEPVVLEAFFKLAAGFDTLISFHGSGFDLPFLEKRCRKLSLPYSLTRLAHVDLFRRICPFDRILKLENRKQKTLERFLGLHREDPYSGGELIEAYHAYCRAPAEDLLLGIKLHNYEDVLGMVSLLSLLAYEALFQGNFSVRKPEVNRYREYEAEETEGPGDQELILFLTPAVPLPKRISYGQEDLYLSGDRTDVRLRIKIFQGELKYFYPNYKDYYYLPQEDLALHKSVASYVDKEFRTQAKAATCYSKKSGCFLPQYSSRFSPCFKPDYQDKHTFFAFNQDFLSDPALQKDYALHLLQHLLGGT